MNPSERPPPRYTSSSDSNDMILYDTANRHRSQNNNNHNYENVNHNHLVQNSSATADPRTTAGAANYYYCLNLPPTSPPSDQHQQQPQLQPLSSTDLVAHHLAAAAHHHYRPPCISSTSNRRIGDGFLHAATIRSYPHSYHPTLLPYIDSWPYGTCAPYDSPFHHPSHPLHHPPPPTFPHHQPFFIHFDPSSNSNSTPVIAPPPSTNKQMTDAATNTLRTTASQTSPTLSRNIRNRRDREGVVGDKKDWLLPPSRSSTPSPPPMIIVPPKPSRNSTSGGRRHSQQQTQEQQEDGQLIRPDEPLNQLDESAQKENQKNALLKQIASSGTAFGLTHSRNRKLNWKMKKMLKGQGNESLLDYEPQTLTEFLQEFAVTTSAHGIPRVGQAKSHTGRIVWAIVFLLCFGMFSYQVYWVIEKYLRNEKIVNIGLAFEKVPFPAVTLCNLNPYKLSKLSEIADLKKNMEEFERNRESLPNQDAELSRESRGAAATAAQVQPLFLPGLANCECQPEKPSCSPIFYSKPADNSSTCICTYDRKQDTAWPCHPMSEWTNEQCVLCSSNGYCVAPWTVSNESDRKDLTPTTPCVCQNLTNICLKVKEGSRFLRLWDFMTTSAPMTRPSTTTNDPELIDALGFEGISDEIAMVTKARENLVFSMANLPLKQRIKLSYTKQEFIKKCSFNGGQCDIKHDFKQHVDPVFGNCYTFNYQRLIMKRSSRAGPMYGLRVFLYINVTDFLLTSENKGVRIAIHNQTEMPFPDAYGFSAPTGFTSSFGIKMKLMNRLPKPYGDCVEQGRVKDYIYPEYDYSPEGCYRTCFQRQLTGRCGCGDPRFPTLPGYNICAVNNATSRACLEEMVNTAGLNSVKQCDCGNPCNQAVFSVSFSASKWPSGSSKPADCPKQTSKSECIQTYQDNAAMIVNVMADFGGQLGLWMGISVITCAEFFVLIWDMTKFCVLKLRNRYWKAAEERRKLGEEERQEELGLEEQMGINGTNNNNNNNHNHNQTKYFTPTKPPTAPADSAHTYDEVKQFNL